jgi:hypothetical protein
MSAYSRQMQSNISGASQECYADCYRAAGRGAAKAVRHRATDSVMQREQWLKSGGCRPSVRAWFARGRPAGRRRPARHLGSTTICQPIPSGSRSNHTGVLAATIPGSGTDKAGGEGKRVTAETQFRPGETGMSFTYSITAASAAVPQDDTDAGSTSDRAVVMHKSKSSGGVNGSLSTWSKGLGSLCRLPSYDVRRILCGAHLQSNQRGDNRPRAASWRACFDCAKRRKRFA